MGPSITTILYTTLYILTVVWTREIHVTTNLGNVIGYTKPVQVGPSSKDISIYLGIPYAESPVGDLRFAKPVTKRKFAIPINATDYSASCLQFYPIDLGVQDEDCLYLNIFSPDINQNGTKYPVMIWIHGGGFIFGNGRWQTFEKLAAFGDVTVVTFNYRLGPLGFLNTGDGAVTANAGLWDQHTAIKWVHNHIEGFGGDPQKVTIAGESAGSASAMFQAIYPGNEGLFIRVIAQSGSSNSPWSTVTDPGIPAKEYAKRFNCSSSSSSQKMIACLRDVKDIVVPGDSLSYTYILGDGVEWSPSIDHDFVTQERIDALNRPIANIKLSHFNKLDLLMGTDGFEGGFFFSLNPNTAYYEVFNNISMPISDVQNASRSFISSALQSVYGKTIAAAILDDVMFQYSNYKTPSDRNLHIKNVIDILTDISMLVPTSTSLENHAFESTGSDTYQYEFNELYPFRDNDPWNTGAIHADDLAYVFGSIYDRGVSHNVTSDELTAQWQLSATVMTYWTNFVKTGNPNIPVATPIQWKKYTDKVKNYLYLTKDKIENGVNLHGRRTAFWTEYLPKILERVKADLEKTETKDCDHVSSSVTVGNSVMLNIVVSLSYIMWIY